MFVIYYFHILLQSLFMYRRGLPLVVEIAVDGCPTTGKSSLIAGLSDNYEIVPELTTFLPDRVRSYPKSAKEYEQRVLAEFENLVYRADRYGDDDTVCEMSVVGTVAFSSLLGELVGVDDPARIITSAIDQFGDMVRHPDVFVFLTASPTVVQSRWSNRSISSTFWSDPAVITYLNEFYRQAAHHLPAVVINSGKVDYEAAVARLRDAPSRISADESVDLCSVLRQLASQERPVVDWSVLEDDRYVRLREANKEKYD